MATLCAVAVVTFVFQMDYAPMRTLPLAALDIIQVHVRTQVYRAMRV